MVLRSADNSTAHASTDATRADVLDAVQAVAAALTAGVALDELLHLIAERICGLVGVRRCSIHLRDGDSGLFRGQVGHANRNIDRAVKRLVDGGPADRFTQEIVTTRRPVLLTNPTGDPRAVRSAMRQWDVKAVLGVPMVLADEVIGIIVLDDEDELHHFTDADQTLATTFATITATAIQQTQQTLQLRETLATVARQHQLLKRATQMEERLATRLLRGSSVAEIGQAVAALTLKPCVIYDRAFETVAACAAEESSPHVPCVLDREIRELPTVTAALHKLHQGSSTVVIDPVPQTGLSKRLLVAAINAGTDRWGYLALVEQDGPLDSADALLTKRAAQNISLQLSATRRAAGEDWEAGEALATGLIRGDSDLVSLQQRADLLGVRLDLPRVVCIVHRRHAAGDETALPGARRLVDAFSDFGHGRTLAANAPGESVALLAVPPQLAAAEQVRWLAERLRPELDDLSDGGGLFAALSPVALTPSDYAPAYDDARQVMQCLEGFVRDAGNHVLTADELGPAQVFLSAAGAARGRRFAQTTLGQLLNPDSPKMRELLLTLIAFHDASHGIREAAEQLHVHKNTVRYRLERIQEVTGLDVVDDVAAQLAAHMSLTILRLGGELPATATVSGQ